MKLRKFYIYLRSAGFLFMLKICGFFVVVRNKGKMNMRKNEKRAKKRKDRASIKFFFESWSYLKQSFLCRPKEEKQKQLQNHDREGRRKRQRATFFFPKYKLNPSLNNNATSYLLMHFIIVKQLTLVLCSNKIDIGTI